ncbi:lysis protein [Pseudomonas fluorescens]|jgi:prophage endopeptidase|uniref:Lysis protein n=2 Tax=Pseudomonas TaxID=286 RepID=A0ABT5NAX3_9PSED|nr:MULTISPECIES: lysis system i-spanin subunit Rz [Pseudomonas]AYG09538.1 lysis protein [Pseudomonas fluorescens]MDZ4301419.1 lysis system i-spanin subunit Rz [Pseudomonas sp.]OAE16575.1 lysozyme [Pseudomonas brenneri]MBJ2251392.1 lysis protein [Pseudomonas sp. MF6784]MBJ2262754.1 lysis protein [Pseudomonas sp. MF6787]
MPLSGRIWAVALLMAISAAASWQVQAWRHGLAFERQAARHSALLNRQSQEAQGQYRAEQDRRRALEQQLHASDQQHTRELSDAQRHQVYLRDRLATADVRLSVLLDATDPANGRAMPATAAGSVVHGAPRGRLDPAHAQRIIGITDAGDNGLIALRACQAYVSAITR